MKQTGCFLQTTHFLKKKKQEGFGAKGVGKCIAERRKAGAIKREFVLKAQSTPLWNKEITASLGSHLVSKHQTQPWTKPKSKSVEAKFSLQVWAFGPSALNTNFHFSLMKKKMDPMLDFGLPLNPPCPSLLSSTPATYQLCSNPCPGLCKSLSRLPPPGNTLSAAKCS